MPSVDYIIKRLGFAFITVAVAVTMNFVLFRAAPGDATRASGDCRNCTEEYREALRRDLGLDKSTLAQYGLYIEGLAQGNLGRSFITRRPVWDELRKPLLNTLPMVALGVLLGVGVGIIFGLISAWRRGTVIDSGLLSLGLVFYSLPLQWLGLMLILMFAGVLPTTGISDPFLAFTDPSPWTQFMDRLKHMILPAGTIALVTLGQYALIVRTSLLESLGEDYVMTARAKGFSNWTILRRYALRNSSLPILTLVALSLGYLVAGTILVESVFSYPGIGLETYHAVVERDYPVLQGAFLLLTLAVIGANFVADLLYLKLDPRVAA